MGLGRHLVREFGFDDQRDTLGRWMAHHVAELIKQAEDASDVAERVKARKSATETILKIWEHRTSLPGAAYPLAPYKDVLKVVDLLRPSDNVSRYFGPHPEAKREQLAAVLFDRLSRLIIALLLMKLPPGRRFTEVNATAFKALSKKEQHVLKALQQWSELFELTSKNSGRSGKSKRRGGAKVNLNEAAVELIDSISSVLVELRGEFKEVRK